MLHFLRRIRRSLVGTGATSKYLLYAIGEIALVVIGILIALQINNWNEFRNERVEEQDILESLVEMLQKDYNNLKISTAFQGNVQNSISVILSNLEETSTYNDTLGYHFWNLTSIWTIPITESVFEILKSKGVDLITNRDLRNEVIDFYDIHSRSFQQGQIYYWEFLEHASKNIFNSRFDSFWSSNYGEIKEDDTWDEQQITEEMTGQMIPVNFEGLKLDLEFKYFLRTLNNRYQAHVKMPTEKMQIKIKQLMEMIEKELSDSK